MAFTPKFDPRGGAPGTALAFAFKGFKLLVTGGGRRPAIPAAAELSGDDQAIEWRQLFGEWEGRPCTAVCLRDAWVPPAGFEWKGLRELFGVMEEELVWAAGRASQLVHWHRLHRFCGRCGQPTADHPAERAKLCPACGLLNHPRVSPAIIVAVIREGRILLAHAARFPARFYSVLAGFVEPGESLEECVRREVWEEVGVRVDRIRYFGSQPWPFPDSLMVGFTAAYAGGELAPNPAEIVDAAWFSADALPEIPPPISIARRLIDWFRDEFGSRRAP
jgi:NAD+ diphosphatase